MQYQTKTNKNMIRINVKGKVYNEFTCDLETAYQASEFLKMLSSIDKESPYVPIEISVQTQNLIGNEYIVHDNSYAINLDNKKSVSLVQRKSEWYSPDKKEKGAKFVILSNPYIEKDGELFNFYHIFVNVVSKKTGKIYRVLFFDGGVVEK